MSFRNLYKKSSLEWKVINDLNAWVREGVTHCEPEHKRCEENAGFERGYQWAEGDIQRQAERDRPALPLNSLLKLVNGVANREIMDRIVPKILSRKEEDNALAEALDMACQWQREKAETEHEESTAFRRCVMSGLGVMHKHWDPLASDGDGMIADEEVPIWYMLWDPRARKQNLVDRKWHISGKYVDFVEAKEEFGELSKEAKRVFQRLATNAAFDIDQGYDATRGGSPVGASGTWGQILGNRWLSTSAQEIFLIEAEWKEVVNYYKVAYPVLFDQVLSMVSDQEGVVDLGQDEQGQPIQFTNQQYMQMDPQAQLDLLMQLLSNTELRKFEDKSEFSDFAEQYESLMGVKFVDFKRSKRTVYKYAIVTDGTILDHGVRPMGFTYEFLTGYAYETREKIEHFGMIDVAKGPQDFKNALFSNLLTMYMTSPKQHLIIEEGALNDPEQFLDEYAKVSGVSFVPDGFVANQRFIQLQQPRFPDMIGQLIEMADSAVEDIWGLSSIEASQQGDLRRVSGTVVTAAKQATNTLLALIFDALRRYRKRWGLLTLKYLLEAYEPEELAQMVGETKVPALSQISSWPEVFTFDIKVDEAPTSVSEQMETIDYLTRTGTLDNWRASGDVDFPGMLDLLVTIPKSTRDKLSEAWRQRQDTQQQIQQLQQQLEQKSQEHELLKNFVRTNPGGNAIIAQYDLLNQLAQQHAQAMQEQQQQQEQQQ